jgi:hypothetical protein
LAMTDPPAPVPTTMKSYSVDSAAAISRGPAR